MVKYLRLLLVPVSWLYFMVTAIRNRCYDLGIFHSRSFDTKVISVGNLDVGGAGKSPVTEYLIRLLTPGFKLATLSRGYGRKTRGYIVATTSSDAESIGDEPAQFKHKFPGITVAVCEKRAEGIDHLKDTHSLVILDDAYQHRAVKPGLSILLFDYSRIFEPRLLLPAGNLREAFGGKKRADIIVITKCSTDIGFNEMDAVKARVKPLQHQKLFFSYIAYSAPLGLNRQTFSNKIDHETEVFLLTGIANPLPLVNYLKTKAGSVIHHNYPDHYRYTLKNIAKLVGAFGSSRAIKKVIVTTEKDAERLRVQAFEPVIKNLPICLIPIEVGFLDNGEQQFNELITNYVR